VWEPTSPTPAADLAGAPIVAARRLLGAVITARGVSARIVEVEAYGGPADGPWPDAAAHAYRGRTARNAVMFGPPGRLYTYRSHGIHVCANISCGGDGVAAAVLLRAAVIESGGDIAQSRRGPTVGSGALARGPGNLCAALAITMADNGADVLDPVSPVTVGLGDPTQSPPHPAAGPRVGVSRAADRAWRLWVPGRPEVSAYRRSPRAPRPGASD
jgi:DNA-3-methyladenine glycosylase